MPGSFPAAHALRVLAPLHSDHPPQRWFALAIYALTASNASHLATSGAATVTDLVPSGLYPASVSGTGWTCSVVSNASGSFSRTCARSDAPAAGASYPAITVAVNVSPARVSSVANSTNIPGAGDADVSNDYSHDTTTAGRRYTTPVQGRRYGYFHTTANTGNAADTANPSGDGLNNLTKYAPGLNPTVPTVTTITEDPRTGYLRLTVSKNANATDLNYSVQATSDLTDPASWTTAGTTVDQNTSTLLQVQDNTPVSGAAKRFIRPPISR